MGFPGKWQPESLWPGYRMARISCPHPISHGTQWEDVAFAPWTHIQVLILAMKWLNRSQGTGNPTKKWSLGARPVPAGVKLLNICSAKAEAAHKPEKGQWVNTTSWPHAPPGTENIFWGSCTEKGDSALWIPARSQHSSLLRENEETASLLHVGKYQFPMHVPGHTAIIHRVLPSHEIDSNHLKGKRRDSFWEQLSQLWLYIRSSKRIF